MTTSKPRVAILGCGPAGMFSAHAAMLAEWEATIYATDKRPSPLGGAQYLHARIPYLSPPEPKGQLKYVKFGTREGYAARVYGSPSAPCSWDEFPEGFMPAWDLHATYQEAWTSYHKWIVEQHVRASDVAGLLAEFDLVISTIPLPNICRDPLHHEFESVNVTLIDEAPEVVEDNVICYNGGPVGPWYRTSRIFGHASAEIAGHPSPLPAGGRRGYKPTTTNCDCHPSVAKVGRFGQWRKGVLLHHAFRDAKAALAHAL